MALEDDFDKMTFVVTPFNLLGKQYKASVGLSAIAVSSENANTQTFKGKNRVVIINPEILMGNDNVEGHRIKQWGSYRKEYMLLENLRYLIPETIPFYVVILLDIVELLHLRPDATEQTLRSNGRPKISIMVRSLVYPVNSYKDLAFVIPEGLVEGDAPPPKVLNSFNNTKETEAACKWLRS
ncbi:hypothetical protein DXG01_005678 [Tephrocybe rancida]|nr:hypothetical protein DXG01_005678 [Tephrocybe rancida]